MLCIHHYSIIFLLWHTCNALPLLIYVKTFHSPLENPMIFLALLLGPRCLICLCTAFMHDIKWLGCTDWNFILVMVSASILEYILLCLWPYIGTGIKSPIPSTNHTHMPLIFPFHQSTCILFPRLSPFSCPRVKSMSRHWKKNLVEFCGWWLEVESDCVTFLYSLSSFKVHYYLGWDTPDSAQGLFHGCAQESLLMVLRKLYVVLEMELG